MTARRTEIRNAFATALTGLTTTGARVFCSRTRPLAATELPAILVFSGEETPLQMLLTTSQPIQRRYELRADIMLKDNTGAEDTADTILAEIEAALFASVAANTLAGKVGSITLKAVGSPDIDDSTEKPCLRLPVLFETVYS